MDYVLNGIILLVGFILLIKGADVFVEGASAIAKKLGISTLVIGLTIVAFGTSAPEAAVSISSALKGNTEIALSNITGSALFNLLMAIGLAAIIYPLNVKASIIKKDYPFYILSAVALFILSADVFFSGATENVLSKADGLMLLLLFVVFMYYLIELAMTSKVTTDDEVVTMSLWKSIGFSIGGLAGVIFGGNLVVNSASSLALQMGMSQSLIGLTIVAIGTSLPELVTSIVAAKKGEVDIVLGNIIGSNIFNIMFILGTTAVICPIPVTNGEITNMIFIMIVTLIAYIFVISKKQVSKLEGWILSLMYLGYMGWIIFIQ